MFNGLCTTKVSILNTKTLFIDYFILRILKCYVRFEAIFIYMSFSLDILSF